jgi:hypothetical protein
MGPDRKAPAVPRGSGELRVWVLAPVLAWLAVAVVAGIYLNQRGRWDSLSGAAGYRDCFGAPPPADLRLIRCEARRRFRYTGELLAMECYVQAQGEFDTSGSDWKDAGPLRESGGLASLLRERGLIRAPGWFRLPGDTARAKVLRSGDGRLFSIYPVGAGGILIAGGWRTKGR